MISRILLAAATVAALASAELAETTTCATNSNTDFSTDHRTLVMAIELNADTSAVLGGILSNFDQVWQAVHVDLPGWIDNIIVHAYSGTNSSVFSDTFSNETQAYATMQQLQKQSSSIPSTCDAPLFDVLDVLNSKYGKALSGAYILMLTSAPPKSDDPARAAAVVANFPVVVPTMDILLAESPSCPYWNGQHSYFGSVIRATAGIVYRANAADADDTIVAVVHSRRASYRLVDALPEQCTATFRIETTSISKNAYISLSGSAANTKVTVVDSNLNVIATHSIIADTSLQTIITFPVKTQGTLTVKVLSADRECFPAVYETGGPRVFFGFVSGGATNDNARTVALSGVDNTPIFAVVDDNGRVLNPSYARLTYVSIIRYDDDGFPTALSTNHTITYRDNCAFNYFSPAFQCNYMRNEIVSVVVYGIDQAGILFNRRFTTFCKDSGAQPPVTVASTLSTSTVDPSASTSAASTVTVSTAKPVQPTTGGSAALFTISTVFALLARFIF